MPDFRFIGVWPAGNRALVPGALRLLLAFLLLPGLSRGYTVLTHEAIIDSVWDASLQKILLKRFPNATPEELEMAHGYAYGGCIIQDMGYYPFKQPPFQRSHALCP